MSKVSLLRLREAVATESLEASSGIKANFTVGTEAEEGLNALHVTGVTLGTPSTT